MLLSLLLGLIGGVASAGDVVIDFLDVGQGDSTLIRGGGKAVLIDAGIADARVAGQLKSLGVRQLDLVVATHAHADHIGGMADVLGLLDVKLYVDSGLSHETRAYDRTMEQVEAKHIKHLRARTDMTLRMGDEAILHVLWPGETYLKDTRSDLNSNSVVIWLEHGEIDALFTGDAEEPTEHALLRGKLPEVEVLKVAHHGSAHSSTPAFLARTSPEIAVISCGKDNRYGHPDAGTVKRLASHGAMVFRTDLSGQVRVISNGSEVEVMEGDLSLFRTAPSAVATQDDKPMLAAQAPQPAPSKPEPTTTEAPEDVASWLSGVRPSTGVPEEDTGKKKKKKKRTKP
ncbi:MAG: MBL fold metallo-hydrolase [Deltaproteobacteria bacterium]|nr:MAG: MBL fold metallo-hydrolase [Deltaproteobacteria bacterium]